jgi:hypothetical protein
VNYAARYPGNVEALVLDSVVPPEGQDTFRRSSLRAVPRVLRDLCAADACALATPNVTGDLAALTRRLARRPLRGSFTDSRGRERRGQLSETDVMRILLAGDLNPTLRAELPGSLRAALRGDETPLLRLGARSAGLASEAPRLQARASADSDALFFATLCEETAFRGRGAAARGRAPARSWRPRGVFPRARRARSAGSSRWPRATRRCAWAGPTPPRLRPPPAPCPTSPS